VTRLYVPPHRLDVYLARRARRAAATHGNLNMSELWAAVGRSHANRRSVPAGSIRHATEDCDISVLPEHGRCAGNVPQTFGIAELFRSVVFFTLRFAAISYGCASRAGSRVETMSQALSNEAIRKAIAKGTCPDCGHRGFLPGPRGLALQNVRCAKCGALFCVLIDGWDVRRAERVRDVNLPAERRAPPKRSFAHALDLYFDVLMLAGCGLGLYLAASAFLDKDWIDTAVGLVLLLACAFSLKRQRDVRRIRTAMQHLDQAQHDLWRAIESKLPPGVEPPRMDP
jgi:hypothetical protein